MTAEQAFLQLFQKLMPKAAVVSVGTVKSVDKSNHTCDVERDGQPTLFNCRLNATIDKHESHLVAFPAKDSFVAVLIYDPEGTDSIVIATTAIDEISAKIKNTTMVMTSDDIVFNGGVLGGIVKVSELTKQLNGFVNVFNTHTHVVNTTGSATAQSGMAQVVTVKQSDFKQADYENKKVKHG